MVKLTKVFKKQLGVKVTKGAEMVVIEIKQELQSLRDRSIGRITGNAFMVSLPGHNFWKHVFQELERSTHNPDPFDTTGSIIIIW